jgi:hypothetical protein
VSAVTSQLVPTAARQADLAVAWLTTHRADQLRKLRRENVLEFDSYTLFPFAEQARLHPEYRRDYEDLYGVLTECTDIDGLAQQFTSAIADLPNDKPFTESARVYTVEEESVFQQQIEDDQAREKPDEKILADAGIITITINKGATYISYPMDLEEQVKAAGPEARAAWERLTEDRRAAGERLRAIRAAQGHDVIVREFSVPAAELRSPDRFFG